MRYAFLATLLLLMVPDIAHATACTSGSNSDTCTTDTTNDAKLVAAINDPVTQARVWTLWNQQCAGIFNEQQGTANAGHAARNMFCLSIAAGKVPLTTLVSLVLNSAVAPEVEACAPTPGPTATPQSGLAAGCMADVDVNTAIDTALTVTIDAGSTTASGASGSQILTVASGTSIYVGQGVFCTACAAGTTVTYVSATTIGISAPLTGTISSTTIAFVYVSGIPARAWP